MAESVLLTALNDLRMCADGRNLPALVLLNLAPACETGDRQLHPIDSVRSVWENVLC